MIRTSPFTCDPLVMPLRDGTPVLVRAVGPEDKIRLQDGLSRMSTWSIYRRFARTVSRLTADELRYLTEVDQENHIAWGAVDPSDPHETGLGISRLIRDPYCPTRAEVAVAVVDEYQQLGLGTILLAALYALAQARGIETLRAVVLPDNHVVLAWLLRLGALHGDGVQTTLDLLPGDLSRQRHCPAVSGCLGASRIRLDAEQAVRVPTIERRGVARRFSACRHFRRAAESPLWNPQTVGRCCRSDTEADATVAGVPTLSPCSPLDQPMLRDLSLAPQAVYSRRIQIFRNRTGQPWAPNATGPLAGTPS